MPNVLFVTWDGGGNVPPAIAIALEMKRRGSAVRFLGHNSQRASLERAGFEFEQFSADLRSSVTSKNSTAKSAVGMLGMMNSKVIAHDLRESVRSNHTDLVVVDCLLFSALKVAGEAGIPHAILVHSLFAAVLKNMVGGVPGIVARMRGVRTSALFGAGGLVLVAALRELDGASSPQLTHTGPAIPLPVEQTRGFVDRPLVLVSLSTTFIAGQREALQRILNALDGLDAHVIVTTGPAIDPASLSVPVGVEVHRYLPHSEVMPRATLVIGHGGHATTMLALAHGIPLVIMPMSPLFDQPIIGAAIVRAGAGESLPKSASVREIRAAAERMLAPGIHRASAARLGAAIGDARGIESAADALEKCIDLTQR